MELRGSVAADIPQGGIYDPSEDDYDSSSTKQKYYFSSWAKNDIERAMALDIIPESLNGDDLSEGINRAQFAAVAVKAYEKMSGKTLSKGSNPFKDSSDSYVVKAANADIVAGTSSTTFSPSNGLTREQAAAMLTRAYKKTVFSGWSLDNDYSLEYSSGDSFNDFNEIRPYARESVGFLSANGVISGVGRNMFAPENTLTKEQAIAIAVRMIDKLDTTPRNGKKTEPVTEKKTEQTTIGTKEPISPTGELKSGDVIKWGTSTITYTDKPVQKRELSSSELSQFSTGSVKAIAGYSYTNEDGEHLLLSAPETVSFDVSNMSATDRAKCYAVSVEPDGKEYLNTPDPDELSRGRYTYQTMHCSSHILKKDENKDIADEWIKKASVQYTMGNFTNVSLEKSIRETIESRMSAMGLGKGQVAGEIARYIVGHHSVGTIMTAAADGDTDTVKKELANCAGEYLLGKLIKEEKYIDIVSGEELPSDTEFLKQSMGDNADAISKGIAEGDIDNQMVEVIKNIEKNMFPVVGEVEKFAALCNTMKNIWEDDQMNWVYESNFKACKDNGQALSYDEFIAVATPLMKGSKLSLSNSELYEQFELRYKNEQEIKQNAQTMRKFFDLCDSEEFELFDPDHFSKLDPKYIDDNKKLENRLNRLWNIRCTIKDMLTVNGKLSKGNIPSIIASSNDELFFAHLVEKWVQYKQEGNFGMFYQYLVDNKIFTLKQAKKYNDDVGNICTCGGEPTVGCKCENCMNPFCQAKPITDIQSVSQDSLTIPEVDVSSVQ